MIKGKVINGHFVKEYVIVDVKFVNAEAPKMMLIDNGVPKSVVSRELIDRYLRDMKVNEEEIRRKSCYRRFKMGETTYLSEVEIRFPGVLKIDKEDSMKREVMAYIINVDLFLLGRETIKEWRVKVDPDENKLEFKEEDKKVGLIETEG